MSATNLEFYKSLLGVPFVDGGRTPEEGFDCWGLSRYVYKEIKGIELPTFAISCKDASAIGERVEIEVEKRWKKVEIPEELCVQVMRFNSIFCNHIGIYIGEGLFLHTSVKAGANIDSIHHPYWKRHIAGFYIPIIERGK